MSLRSEVLLFDSLGAAVAGQFADRRDSVPVALLYAPDAATRLARCLSADVVGRRALLVGDTRTRAVAGSQLQEALAREGWSCRWLTLQDGEDGTWPVCDESTRARCEGRLGPADVYIAAGSGVINDLTKWLAAQQGVDYAVVATAASMNGYAAANVAPAIHGVKSLVRARAPRYVAAIPSVIEAAPLAMTAAGLGDLVARSVSTADWKMNHLMFGEPFSQALAQLSLDAEPSYLSDPSALCRREPAAIRGLFEALVYSGCAMTLYGSSLPASGGEHLISHSLDMMACADGVAHDLHGRQVGVAAIFAAALYERMMSIEGLSPTCARAPLSERVWKGAAPAVRLEHERKGAVVERACQWLGQAGAWERLRAELKPILGAPDELRQRLRSAGAASRLQDIGCTHERFLQAVVHCGAMRARFTSIDLGWVTGVLPGEASALISEWIE